MGKCNQMPAAVTNGPLFAYCSKMYYARQDGISSNLFWMDHLTVTGYGAVSEKRVHNG